MNRRDNPAWRSPHRSAATRSRWHTRTPPVANRRAFLKIVTLLRKRSVSILPVFSSFRVLTFPSLHMFEAKAILRGSSLRHTPRTQRTRSAWRRPIAPGYASACTDAEGRSHTGANPVKQDLQCIARRLKCELGSSQNAWNFVFGGE